MSLSATWKNKGTHSLWLDTEQNAKVYYKMGKTKQNKV